MTRGAHPLDVHPDPRAPNGGDADPALLAAAVRGSERAFVVLYERFTPRLRGIVRRLVAGTGVEEDDVIQELWVRAMQRLETYRGDATLLTWLTGIGIRVLREAWRAEGRRLPMAGALERARDATADPVTDRIDLERALLTLPVRLRAVVVLHDVEGFTHADIAQQLDIAVGSSKAFLWRARQLLRAALDGHGRMEDVS